jgi:hypothetical protein
MEAVRGIQPIEPYHPVDRSVLIASLDAIHAGGATIMRELERLLQAVTPAA